MSMFQSINYISICNIFMMQLQALKYEGDFCQEFKELHYLTVCDSKTSNISYYFTELKDISLNLSAM